MARLALALMVIVLLLTSTIALAQDSLSIRHLDEMANLSERPRIQIDDNLMVVSAKSGLIVSDISDPEHPVSRNILTNLDPSGRDFSPPFALYVDLLVVACHETVSLYRIHSIDHLELLDQLSFEEHWCTALAMNHVRIVAYVSMVGLVTINSEDPSNLSVIGRLEGRYYQDLMLSQFLAFSWGYDSTKVVTIIDPQEPRTLATFRRAWDIAVDANERLFLLTSDSLLVYDIQDPENINQIASLTTPGADYPFSQAISVEGDRIAVAFEGGLVKLYEITDELALNQLGEFRTPTRWPRDCQIRGDNIFSAGGVYGGVVTVIDASEPANLREVAEIGMIEDSHNLLINDYLICTSDTSIMTKYWLDDEGRFQKAYRGYHDADEEGGYFDGGTRIGDAVYETFYGIRIWDCSDPMNIRYGATANWPANREINFFAGNESFAALAWRDSTLEIFSTEDIYDPQNIGQVNFGGLITGLGLGDSVAFAGVRAAGDSLRLLSIDLHSDHWLEIRDSITIGDSRAYSWGYYVKDGILFSRPDTDCDLINVSDPSAMSLLCTIDSLISVQTIDNWMFYSHRAGGIRLLNIRDPFHPVEVWRNDDPRTFSLQIVDDVLLANYSGGVVAYQIDGLPNVVEPSARVQPELLTIECFPNPFNSSTRISFSVGARHAVPLHLAIYDLSGREVASFPHLLAGGELKGGSHSVTWDASAQPAGLYFVRLKAGGMVSSQRLVIVK